MEEKKKKSDGEENGQKSLEKYLKYPHNSSTLRKIPRQSQ